MTTPTYSAAVDFSKSLGEIKRELTSTNYAPTLLTKFSNNPEFAALRTFRSRTANFTLANRGQRSQDIHFLFPLEHLDADDPMNYYFDPTDCMLENVLANNVGILFTLGTSIENNLPGHNYNSRVPADFDHYADICAHVIRHFTKGWNKGFKWNIQYWEIWNAPDMGPNSWMGTQKQFIDFYVVMLRTLKKAFPKLKFGGPSLTSIRSTWVTPLLKRLKQEGLKPDFFSFKCYTNDLDELQEAPKKARKLLDSYGMTDTEVIVSEWSYIPDSVDRSTPEAFEQNFAGPYGLHGIVAAAQLAATIINWHDAPVDQAYFFGAGNGAPISDFDFMTYYGALNKKYYALKMASDIANDTPKRVQATANAPEVAILAGKDDTGKKCQLLVADFVPAKRKDITIQLNGVKQLKKAKITRLSNTNDAEEIPVDFKDGVLTLKRDYLYAAVFQIQFEK